MQRLKTAVGTVAACLVPVLGCGAATSQTAPSRTTAASTAAAEHRTLDFPVTGMLALPGDALLFWNADGRVQWRLGSGSWSVTRHLPVRAILSLRADAQGALVLGTAATGRTTALLLSPGGDELGRWELPENVLELQTGADGRWGLATQGRMPLWEGGKSGPMSPHPSLQPDGVQARGPAPVAFSDDHGTVLCQAGSLAKAYDRLGRCERSGARAWRYEGRFVASPLDCGPYMAIRERPPAGRLRWISRATGALAGTVVVRPNAAIACNARGELLIGEHDLRLLRLPDARAVWRSSVRRSTGARTTGITALAATEHVVAYQVGAETSVALLPLPGRAMLAPSAQPPGTSAPP